MDITKTCRGFSITSFKDAGGVECNIQISSAMRSEALIWFGAKETGMRGFVPYRGWREISDSEIKQKLGETDILTNTRMHLTQSQVRALLPYLQKFAETGELE